MDAKFSIEYFHFRATSQTPFSAAMELRNKKLFGKIHRIHSHIKGFSDEAMQDRFDQNHVWNEGKVELMVRATCDGLVPICNDTEHRAFNGVCNNLENPTWGAANTGFKRLLPPEYEDGIGEPKGGFTLAARTGSSLPTPRFVSQQCTGRDGHIQLFSFIPSSFVFKKNYFVCSQIFPFFSIYFFRFLTELSFSEIVCSVKSFVQLKKDSF